MWVNVLHRYRKRLVPGDDFSKTLVPFHSQGFENGFQVRIVIMDSCIRSELCTVIDSLCFGMAQGIVFPVIVDCFRD